MSSGGGTVVHAEEPNQAFTLDPMVVTAQRVETRDLDTPAAVSVITKEEIEKNGLTGLGMMKHWHIFDVIAKKK